MIKALILFLVFGIGSTGSYGQIQGSGGDPKADNSLLTYIIPVTFTTPNIKSLRDEDRENDEKGNGPWRFGFANEVDFNMSNSGQWFELQNGGKVWLFSAECSQALSINFVLKDINLPEGNELYVYNEEKTVVLGKFIANHLYKSQLGTELIQGSKAIIEYYVAPGNSQDFAALTIQRIVHGYRTTDEFAAKAFGSSGACNMNVNCPDGADWGKQKRSTIMLVAGAGTGFCTGALINNTLNDGKPYVLTANHCYSDPTAWLFRFNWEATGCTNPGVSPSFSSLSGGVLRARRTTSDFFLLEITGGLESGAVPASFNPYYAGWDNSGMNPSKTVCIHHPKGDIKKISFDDNPTYPVQSTVNAVDSDIDGSWEVEWDRNTTTESASSGSPLFDQNGRIIGQLWGGQAGCTNLAGNDYYGRLHTSWSPAGSNSTNQLKHWLDPTNMGAIVIDGYDPSVPIPNLDASLIFPVGVNETYCVDQVLPQITIVNLGTTPLTSATIQYGLDGVENQTYNWTGSLVQYASATVSLPSINVSAGPHQFSATSTLPNGGVDQLFINNAVSSNFYTVIGGENVTLNLNLDCYGSETTWELKDQNNVIIYKGEGYANDTEGLLSYSFCLAEECYSFTIFDKYGDGMSGCASGDGSYQILNGSSVIIAELLPANANFGFNHTRPICLGSSALNELNNASFEIHPNPANSTFTVSSQNKIIDKIECVSTTGQVIITADVIEQSKLIDVSSLSKGVYFVKITSSGSQVTTRLVVE